MRRCVCCLSAVLFEQRCGDLKETAEVIAKVGFKMFLGVTAQVVGFDAVRRRGVVVCVIG